MIPQITKLRVVDKMAMSRIRACMGITCRLRFNWRWCNRTFLNLFISFRVIIIRPLNFEKTDFGRQKCGLTICRFRKRWSKLAIAKSLLAQPITTNNAITSASQSIHCLPPYWKEIHRVQGIWRSTSLPSDVMVLAKNTMCCNAINTSFLVANTVKRCWSNRISSFEARFKDLF